VIAWAAAQGWCDGAVATYGGSYAGRIQWLTALRQPPALKAMIVLVTPADPFVEDPTGVPGCDADAVRAGLSPGGPRYPSAVAGPIGPLRYQHRIAEVDLPVLQAKAGYAGAWQVRRQHQVGGERDPVPQRNPHVEPAG
jgi:hypothetical protein